MPAWWRYVDPFFREVHAGDLHAVLPPRRWDDDPDLRLPPFGRKHDAPFEDGLPKPPTPVFVPAAPLTTAPPPKLEPPPPASVSVGVPGVSTIVGPSIPLGPAIPVGMPPMPPASAVAASTATLPGAHSHTAAHASAAPPVPAPPRGAAVGGDLLSLLTPDEVAALFRQRVAFEEDADARRRATAAAARACACEVDHLEAWLGEAGEAPGERGAERKKNEKDKGKQRARESFDDAEGSPAKKPREEGDVAAGLRRWLRDDAAEAALAARDARAAAAVPVAPVTLPDPYARRHPYPAPKVCAVIKSDAEGVVYVAGERPGAPGRSPATYTTPSASDLMTAHTFGAGYGWRRAYGSGSVTGATGTAAAARASRAASAASAASSRSHRRRPAATSPSSRGFFAGLPSASSKDSRARCLPLSFSFFFLSAPLSPGASPASPSHASRWSTSHAQALAAAAVALRRASASSSNATRCLKSAATSSGVSSESRSPPTAAPRGGAGTGGAADACAAVCECAPGSVAVDAATADAGGMGGIPTGMAGPSGMDGPTMVDTPGTPTETEAGGGGSSLGGGAVVNGAAGTKTGVGGFGRPSSKGASCFLPNGGRRRSGSSSHRRGGRTACKSPACTSRKKGST